MKIRVLQFTAPRKVEVVDDTLPDPKKDEVEIQHLYSGISHGTEMNVYRGDAPMWKKTFDPKTRLFRDMGESSFKYPMRYGYTSVGRVTKAGSEVNCLEEGDIVYVESNHGTGSVVKAKDPIKLPASLEPKAGVFLANLGTTFNGVLDAGLRLQENVVVFGQGTLGQFVVQWAKRSGAGQVIAVDLNEKRLKISKEVSGADHTFSPAKTEDLALAVRELTGMRGADVAFEVSASDRALNESIRTVCYNGKVIVLSWYPGSWQNVHAGGEFHLNRVQLLCSQTGAVGPEVSNRWTRKRVDQAVLEIMPELNLLPLISHEIDLEDAAKAYQMIDEGQDDIMQVVLKY